MRDIKFIVLHCTAGPQNQSTEEIKRYWKEHNGWKTVGYHIEINADGSVEQLLSIESIANGVAGHNKNSIHISYKGGIDKKGNAIDNRTEGQKKSQLELIFKYKRIFPNAVVLGHRDFSIDKNGNGIIEQWEWIKSCPAFDVRDWLKEINFEERLRPVKIVYKLNYPLIKDSNVKTIQLALQREGFYNKKIDEFFGEETQKAVIKFQSKNNLQPTGIVDTITAQKLKISI